MKLRSITLDNVRRFTDPVTVGPIGDGVTLLCAPNESGKSTLFDALHAVFFVRHGSQTREIKALRPHSGGAVTVECDLEHEGARWRIRKQWLSGASVRIWRDGALAHQGDAAEDWIAALVSGEAGGPGGLLWVRQGRVSLQAVEKKDEAAELEGRRDLLTAISGAMDAVTGGERMDRALEQVRADLGRLETTTGKPKTGGRWFEAATAVEVLAGQEADLAATVDDLRRDLDERRRLAAELAGLQDPAAAAQRHDAVTEARQALREAESRASEVREAATAAALACQTFETAQTDATRAQARRREADEAAAALGAAVAARTEAAGKAALANAAHAAARGRLDAARQAKVQADAVLRRVALQEERARARRDREALAERIQRAETAETERLAQVAAAGQGPDARTAVRIEALARAVDTQRGIRDASAPRVTARYVAGAPEVTMGGQPLAEGAARPLPEDGRIALPGIGELHIATANAEAGQALRQAETALADALAAGGWDGLDAFRQAVRAREEAQNAADRAAARRDAVAPDGIDALKEQLALLRDAAPDEGDALPDRPTAETAAEAADKALDQAVEAQEKAAAMAHAAATALAKAEATETGATLRNDRAVADLRDLPAADPEAEAARIAVLETNARAATDRHATLAAEAPDLAALTARLKRVTSVAEQAREDARRISGELGKIEGRIETRAEEGVEEALEEVRGRLAAARRTLERVIFEVDVLRQLREALETAQRAARETYFAPVATELRPLLADLWGEAELVWSDDTLLPVALVRRGTEEPMDVLSGGTQEQIAFLVRLAFARLLAKSGRHAPLILDDALVYSDDDRIAKMFDALHGASSDLQIIVLSCRQRAFRDLGAPSLSFRDAPPA